MKARKALVPLLALLLLPALALPSSAEPLQAYGFNIANVQWGTPGNPVDVGSGQQNVPLTVSLQYLFINTATSVAATLSLPQGFTDATTGSSTSTAYSSQNLPSGTVVPLTFYLNTASGVSVGSYIFTLTITWGVNIAANPYAPPVSQSLVQNSQAVVAIKGKAQLQFSSTQPVLTPGTVTRVPIMVSNTGTGRASNVSLSVSASSSAFQPPSVSILNSIPQIAALSANSSTDSYVSIYAPSSTAGSSVTLSVTASYADAYGNPRSVTGQVGLYVTNVASLPVMIRVESPSLTPGDVNNVTLIISNAGQQALKELEIAISIPPSISVLSQFPAKLTDLQAGSSVQLSMPIFVSSALSGVPITIPATITYTDAAGNTGTLTQNLGFYVPVSQRFPENPNISLSGYSYDPPLIYPGTKVASLQVLLANSGTTPASGVNVTLVPSNPVYAISEGSLTKSLGALPIGQSVPLTFTLGIVNSSAPINSTLTLSVRSSGTKPLTLSIPFTEQPKANFQILSVSAPQISVGDGSDQITVTVRNAGRTAARFTTFAMQPSNVFQPSTQGTFTTTANAAVGDLAAGKTANLTIAVQVNPNVQAGTYPLTLIATWSQLGATQQFTQAAKLAILVHPSVFQTITGGIESPPGLAVIAAIILGVIGMGVRRRIRSSRRRASTQST